MKEVTSKDRILNAAKLQSPIDRLPVLPYMREPAIEYIGSSFDECMKNADKYVEAQITFQELLGYDGLWDMIAVPAVEVAMGCKIFIPGDQVPSIMPILDDPKDVKKLKVPDMNDENIAHRLYIIKELRRRANPGVPVIGWVPLPFRVVTIIRGADQAYRDMYKDPGLVKELTEIAIEAYTVYAQKVLEAGADIIHISDPVSSGSCVSRKQYESIIFPPSKKLVDNLRRMGAKTILFHFCGDVNDRLDLAAELTDIIFVDSSFRGVKPDYLRKTIGDKVCLMGGPDVNTVLLYGTQERIVEETNRYIDVVGQNGFILSGSCMMPRDTTLENIQSFIKAGMDYVKNKKMFS